MKTLKEFLEETAQIIQFPTNKLHASNSNKSDAEHPVKKAGDPHKHFDKWTKDNLVHEPGSSLTATRAYEDYVDHAEKHNVEPLGLPEFSKKMTETGIHKQRITGRVRHIGIALKDEQDE